MPLPGFEVKSVEKSDEVQQRDFVFSLTKPGLNDRAQSKTYYFQADDESHRKRSDFLTLHSIVNCCTVI